MTVEEVVNYYLEHFKPKKLTFETDPLNVPIIESWICTYISNKVVVHGTIFNHPQYPSGGNLQTSPIHGYLARDGRVYITTKNSVYELGVPHSVLDIDTQFLMNDFEDEQEQKLNYWD